MNPSRPRRRLPSVLLPAAGAILLLLALLPLPAGAEGRPRVGVVLSGGGAKGMAHIGALRVIEEAGIPVDCVVGTSMGSIIGGLYAIGYRPDQLDSLVRRQDWPFLLSDKAPRSEQSLAGREAAERYVTSIPFGPKARPESAGGLIKGQNLANLFGELTVGYHDTLDFSRLPVPFACVAVDIAGGREVELRRGILPTAMRASMAIPGVFSPVRMDSLVLVDGGVMNNYPADVARRMGADVVIGVDVQASLKPAEELNGTMAVLGQLVDLLGQEKYRRNLDDTDLYIKVDVEGYSAASFTRSAIDTLIRRGREAAEKQAGALARLKRRLGPGAGPARPEAYPYDAGRTVPVREISFDGLDEKDKKWLLKRCDLKENSRVSLRDIKRATAILCSNLEYSDATYRLPEAPGGGYDLRFRLSKKYENKLNLGLRFDTEETASLLVNMTSNFRRKVPATLALTVRLGKRYAARVDYGFEPAPLKNIGLAYEFQYNDINFYHRGEKSHNATFRYHAAELSFSDVWHRNIRFDLGLRYELYDYDKFLYQEGSGHAFDVGTEHFFSYFVRMRYESYDKACFPSRGLSFHADYALHTDNFTGYDGHSPFSAVKGYCEGVIPLTRRLSLLPAAYARFIFGKDAAPYSKRNVMGGDVPGWLLGHQLPFVGINTIELAENALLVGSMKFRQRMGGVHYLTLTGNYALSADKPRNLLDQQTLFGCGLGYGLDSMFGPLEVSFNYANRASKVSMFVNLGFRF